MGYIYKVTNLINGKIYIGQTCYSIEKRIKQHISEANRGNISNSLFHKAILKYGIENFTFEIVELCKEEELDEKE